MTARWVAVTLLVAGGCTSPDLGVCDMIAARAVVLDSSGLPAFEGQALMGVSCANGEFCHSPAAEGDFRHAVPAGLDFHVGLACEGIVSCGADGERLRANQRRTLAWAHDLAREVERDSMPPPGIGAELVAEARSGRAYLRLDGTPLPELESPEGREVLYNWLACGAPVVENARQATPSEQPGDYCGAGPDAIGDCVASGPPRN